MKIKGLEDKIVKFVYLREPKTRKPVVTICLITDSKKEKIGRGISICSVLDMDSKLYNKNEGRNHALRRACDAYFYEYKGEEISRGEAIESVVENAKTDWIRYFYLPLTERETTRLAAYVAHTRKTQFLEVHNLTETEKRILGV